MSPRRAKKVVTYKELELLVRGYSGTPLSFFNVWRAAEGFTMGRAELCCMVEIPYSTMNSWLRNERRAPPPYVRDGIVNLIKDRVL